MINLSKWELLSIFFSVLLIIFFQQVSWGTQFKSGDNFFYSDTSFIDDDLFIAGGNIKFDGTLTGDLFTGCRSLVQNGKVEGNIMAGAQHIDILGEVKRSVRGFSQDFNINGKVGNNLMAFSSVFNLKHNGEVGKDLTMFGGEATIDGKVGKDLKVYAGTVVLSGTIEGNVLIKADKITLMPTTVINGNFNYTSVKEAKIEPGAKIFGETKWKKITPNAKKNKGFFAGFSPIRETLFFLSYFVTGLILTLLFKKQAYIIKERALQAPLQSIAFGFVFIVCALVGIIILLITVIGIPLALILFFSSLVLWYLSKIIVSTVVGEWVTRLFKKQGRVSLIWSLFLGLILVTIFKELICLLPSAIGWIIYFLVVICAGIGAVITLKKQIKLESSSAPNASATAVEPG
jgi:cytoskeletal protein CcmA (bactofilin family)